MKDDINSEGWNPGSEKPCRLNYLYLVIVDPISWIAVYSTPTCNDVGGDGPCRFPPYLIMHRRLGRGMLMRAVVVDDGVRRFRHERAHAGIHMNPEST
jgi:hypothetical protein